MRTIDEASWELSLLNAKKLVVYSIVHYGRKKSHHQVASGPKSSVKEGRTLPRCNLL